MYCNLKMPTIYTCLLFSYIISITSKITLYESSVFHLYNSPIKISRYVNQGYIISTFYNIYTNEVAQHLFILHISCSQNINETLNFT